MPGWDEDSPELQANLRGAFSLIEASARGRQEPSLREIKEWHRRSMRGLTVPHPSVAGNFRGADGHAYLRDYDVRIGIHLGARWRDVERETKAFERELQARVARLDGRVAQGDHPQTDDEIDGVIELAAWVHAEWVRVHPFANGNGRTARMWANWILLRYGVPPFVVLRPRPGGRYGAASAAAMTGNVQPTIDLFNEMFDAWAP